MSTHRDNPPTEFPIVIDRSPVTSFVEVPIDAHHRYTSLELQTLAFADGRHGHAVIAHRQGGDVDVYYERALDLDDSWRRSDPAMAHLRTGVLREVEFDVCNLDIGPDRIDAALRFEDDHGDLIDLEVVQRSSGGRGLRQFTPSPVRTNLPVLRLLLLDNFSLVRRTSTVRVAVGGAICTPSTFRIPVGFRRRYSARFAGPVLLVGVNPSGQHRTTSLGDIDASIGRVDATHAGLSSVRIGSRVDQRFEFVFDPPLPSLSDPSSMIAAAGAMRVDTPLGCVTTARWEISPEHGVTTCRMSDVRQDWWPSPVRNPSLWLLALIRRARRRAGMSWAGTVLGEPGRSVLESRWQHREQGAQGGG